ncbi:MAG: glycosyltransferase [Thermoleophilaceae bacterium]|nr:glycosyltransferase [Thermoleophilaceae bacterium]
MTRVLVVSGEPVGGAMAGPAIRALELARALAGHCRVTLAAPGPSHVEDPRLELLQATSADFDALLAAIRTHDVVVAQQLPAQLLRYVQKLPIRYVADLYNPLMIELLEALADAGAPRERSLARRLTRAVFAQCAAADFVICASEKQRDLWLGGMGLAGLLDLDSYRRDPTYRAVVDVVPFGLADRPPTHERPVLKGVWPGIDVDDRVLLWGGGIWRWLDAFTPMRAVERLTAEGRRVHLFFMGIDRPGADRQLVPSSADPAVAYARERGLEGACVHFNRGWVPYKERQSYLLEADLGVSAHHDHLEARFSFRTRVLDYLWAGLPMVLARGDSMADLVEQRELGATFDPEDGDGFAAACAELLDDDELWARTSGRVREAASAFRWEEAARPLVDYCVHHRERPVPRKHPVALAMSTYGQYPGILAHQVARDGPMEVGRRMARNFARAFRHGV